MNSECIKGKNGIRNYNETSELTGFMVHIGLRVRLRCVEYITLECVSLSNTNITCLHSEALNV